MSLLSRVRKDHRKVEYSAVDAEQTSDAADDCEARNDSQQDSRVLRHSVDVTDTDTDGNLSHDSALLNSRSNRDSNAKSVQTYRGPTIKGWPAGPRNLRGFSAPLLIGDVLLILLPIAFIVLAISAWRLNGKHISDTGRMVERAMNLGPTIYPLAFAAIGSRCLRSIAIFLAERGTTISTLEKLLGSQSLVSAIGTAGTLRSVDLTTIGLLALWALSPLGGQSSLRLLHQINSTVSERGTIYYSDPAAPIDLDEAGSWLNVVPTILTASLSATVEAKYRPVDSWGHPKVPRLDDLEQQALQSPLSVGPWIDVDPTMNHTYSSWTGVNVQNLRQSEHAEFQIRYNYMYFDCQNPWVETPAQMLRGLLASNISLYPPLLHTPPGSTYDDADDIATDTLRNISNAGSGLRGVGSQSFFLRATQPSNTSIQLLNQSAWQFNFTRQPISYLYGAVYIEGEGFDLYNVFQMYKCSPHVVTVDAQINCQAGDCSVSRLRHVPGESSSSLAKACDTGPVYRLGCMTNGTYAVFTFLRYLPTMMASFFVDADSPGPFDRWITGINLTYTLNKETTRTTITDREKSHRLSTLLNTYWQGSAWGYQITRAGFFEQPQYPYNDSIDSTDSRYPDRWLNSSEAVFTHPVPVYRAEVGWIVSLLLITTILLITSITNVAISFFTIAPDLFYYASSLARENPYTDTPDGGTALDGADRSRLLRKMRVQVADISPEYEVGYVVFKSVDDDDNFQTGRLQKGRLYW